MIGELVPPSVFKTAAGRTPPWVGSIPVRPRQHDPLFQAWQDRESVDAWLTNDDARAQLLRWASTLLPFPASAALNVLDVGAGYGAFAGQILESYRHSTACLADFSKEMLAEAVHRLDRFPGRVRYHLTDLRDPRWDDGLPGPFDVVVSSYVIHSLPDQALVPRLYGAFRRLLRPGGCFVNVDLVLHPPEFSVLADGYLAADPSEPVHPHDEDDERDGDAAGSATLEDHLRWLREAGFAEADCAWKRLRRAVLCAVAG
jgi:tRNA (cmo5U34)-methyltransferase